MSSLESIGMGKTPSAWIARTAGGGIVHILLEDVTHIDVDTDGKGLSIYTQDKYDAVVTLPVGEKDRAVVLREMYADLLEFTTERREPRERDTLTDVAAIVNIALGGVLCLALAWGAMK